MGAGVGCTTLACEALRAAGNIIDVAMQQELTVADKAFTLTELYSAREVFITNASAGVTSVVEVLPACM